MISVPEVNASWEGENTRLFRHADIAMAVAIDGGLITPIVWAAEQKGLAALSQLIPDLADRARDGKLSAGNIPVVVLRFLILACLVFVNLRRSLIRRMAVFWRLVLVNSDPLLLMAI